MSQIDKKEMGKRIKDLRERHKYRADDVAEFLELSSIEYSFLEKGELILLGVTKLEKLCDLYLVPEEYILYGDTDRLIRTPYFKENSMNMETMAKMNKIITNLKLMVDILSKEEEKE